MDQEELHITTLGLSYQHSYPIFWQCEQVMDCISIAS